MQSSLLLYRATLFRCFISIPPSPQTHTNLQLSPRITCHHPKPAKPYSSLGHISSLKASPPFGSRTQQQLSRRSSTHQNTSRFFRPEHLHNPPPTILGSQTTKYHTLHALTPDQIALSKWLVEKESQQVVRQGRRRRPRRRPSRIAQRPDCR